MQKDTSERKAPVRRVGISVDPKLHKKVAKLAIDREVNISVLYSEAMVKYLEATSA